MNVSIVIPTYNEAENVKKLIPQLAEIFKNIPNHTFSALFVDGNSPDGTAKVVQQLAIEYPFAHVLVEKEKGGLGAAYIAGFKYAMSNLNAEVLVEMDADFQHPLDAIPRFIAEIDNGNDYVIGSRFAEGGSIPSNWAFHRKLVSWGGNIFSKLVLGIFTLNDFTSGYKASRVKGFVDQIDLDNILSSGFAYKMDLLYKMHQLGAKIKEVPIKFGLRDRGNSKMEASNFFDSFKVVVLLRIGAKNKSFVKFLGVGVTGLLVDTSLFNILRITLSSSFIAALISGFIAMFTTFMFNNAWSFRDQKIQGLAPRIKGFVVYVSFSIIPILVRSQIVRYANFHFGDTFIISNLAFAVGVCFGLVWNFTVYSKIIWRKGNKNI